MDGGAHERMVGAAKARRMKRTQLGRLQGLLPNPQEFHKRMILLGVNMFKKFHALNKILVHSNPFFLSFNLMKLKLNMNVSLSIF